MKVRFRSGSGKVQLRNITAPFSQLPDPRSHINFKPQTHHSLFIADSFPIKLKPQTHKVTPFTRQLPHNLQASNTPAAHELKEGFKKSREFSLTGKSKMPIFLKPSLMNYSSPTQNSKDVPCLFEFDINASQICLKAAFVKSTFSIHLVFALLDGVRNNFESFYPQWLLLLFPYLHYPLYRCRQFQLSQ